MFCSWKTEFLEIQIFKKLGVTGPGDQIICPCLSEIFLMICRSTNRLCLSAWMHICEDLLIILTVHLAESMLQNAQQHDTGIDPLVLQMLLPLHCLHLLLSHWCSQMLSPPHFWQRVLCNWYSQMLLLLELCTRSSTAVVRAVRYTDVHCPPAPRPHKHIPCLGAVEFGKLFLDNRFFIQKFVCY